MEIELTEIRDFIAIRYPFSTLEEEPLNLLIPEIQIRYLRRGQPFPPQHKNGALFYLVRSGAIELRDRKNQLIGHLAEGDFTAESCEFVDINPTSNSIALEDSLIYTLPCEILRKLIDENHSFQQHFSDSIKERLKLAIENMNDKMDFSMSRLTVEVGNLVHKAPIMLNASSTLQEVAQCMTERQVSSIMLSDDNGALCGLVTDRDLRKRCVAEAVDIQLPVEKIMTTDLQVIDHDSLLLHAMILMTKENIHHLPVVKKGNVIGMLTTTDITRYSSSNPAFISSEIRKANSLEELIPVCSRLPSLQLSLANSSVTARHIGETISSVTDCLTIRLIELAQQDLGPAPVPFAWVAGGSQGRHEQTSHSDQDNALIISDKMSPEDDDYFRKLAISVSDGLHACGFIYCPGDAMATNDKWRKPLKTWRKYFDKWINRPKPEALMLACIFFDLRVIYGNKKLYKSLQSEMLEKARSSKLFLAHMVSNALSHKPPLGFFRKLVLIHDGEHDETLDIKMRGVAPIIDIARVVALADGVSAVNTTERLKAASQTPSLSRSMSENLQDAMEFISSLRIRHQADQIKNGITVDHYLHPDQLSDLERKHLKDAFAVIQDMQDALKLQYNVGQLG